MATAPVAPPAGASKAPATGAEEAFRDTIGTLADDGKRRWIYPKVISGWWMQRRRWVAYALLAFLFAGPFLRIGGQPLLLLDVLNRHFVILGQPFFPQDTYIAVLIMLAAVLFVVVFTVAFGRIFCGWVCPQTIFMEHVFRQVETWIEGNATERRKLDQGPWTTEKVWKKTLKHGLFYAISFLIGNVFLAYVIGTEALWQIVSGPVRAHVGGLVVMALFSAAFYVVFARLREQVCIAACPYGRLQGVLLDRNSLVVAYDSRRGEPRGKAAKAKPPVSLTEFVTPSGELVKKKEDGCDGCNDCTCLAATAFAAKWLETQPQQGDCVDCTACRSVCPTGIDIRNGTQLECISCTACIDACDDVMVKLGRPTGLVRYTTINEVLEGKPRRFTTRMKAYSAVLTVLLVAIGWMLFSRSEVNVNILRLPGTLYQTQANGHITNLYRFTLQNKTLQDRTVEIVLLDHTGTLQLNGGSNRLQVAAGQLAEGVLILDLAPEQLTSLRSQVRVAVQHQGRTLKTLQLSFLGPPTARRTASAQP